MPNHNFNHFTGKKRPFQTPPRKKKGAIPADALIKMSDIFDCSIDYLVGRTDIKS